MIVPVILSGGSGTRLWPLSTPECPKQFLALVGEDSLFKQTLDRVADRERYGPPVIVANVTHEELCRQETSDLSDATLLLEPCARNTAVAIAMAALEVRAVHGPDSNILVMPSDHVIGDPVAFHNAVRVGLEVAKADFLVTFGICPTGPETGYGYIRAGEPVLGTEGALKVESFTEKPDRETAEAMLAKGNHFWNGGIFLYKVDTFIREISEHAPQIADAAVKAMNNAVRKDDVIGPQEAHLADCPGISVDYAVMERSNRVATVPMDAQWSDVGSWDALAEITCGQSDGELVTNAKSTNCYVRSDGLKVGLLGVKDLLVIAAGDRVLIMQKGHSQDVKELAPMMHGNASEAAL